MQTGAVAEATASFAPRLQPRAARLRILVADDQHDVIEAVRLLLESDGLTTIGATTPAQAIEIARTQTVHAALVDLNFEQGRTNGEIGKELFIPTKTASVHVSNVLAKLGAATRGEAAAIARRDALLP